MMFDICPSGRLYGEPPLGTVPILSIMQQGAFKLRDASQNGAYLAMCGNDDRCSGSDFGVLGFSTDATNVRGQWVMEDSGAGWFKLKDETHGAYMGMCGSETGCTGSSYGVYGYKSDPTGVRGRWIMEDSGAGWFKLVPSTRPNLRPPPDSL